MSSASSRNQIEQDISPIESEVLPFIEAGKDRYPSKEALWAEIEHDLEIRESRSKTIKNVLALALVTIAVWTINPTFYTDIYSTTYAERKSVTMPDGSLALLNSNSEIKSNIRLRSREVELVRGEASFTVNHELRPFTVAIDEVKVLDIGTVFNISKWENHFVSTVIEGEVELQTPGGNVRLIAGQAVKVDNNVAASPYAASLDRVTAWQSGKLMFNGVPLAEAITEMQRYRKEPIILDKQIAQLKITGVYDYDKLEAVIDSLPSIFPIKIGRQPDGQINITKK